MKAPCKCILVFAAIFAAVGVVRAFHDFVSLFHFRRRGKADYGCGDWYALLAPCIGQGSNRLRLGHLSRPLSI